MNRNAGVTGPLNTATQDVLAECQRLDGSQEAESGQADGHHELAHAAACYAYPELTALIGVKTWPWAPERFEVRDHRSNYVRGAALLLRAIARMDRNTRASDAASSQAPQYRNPVPVAVALVPVATNDGLRLLAIERGIEPRKGLLALPGGYVDEGENVETAVARELLEETGISSSADDWTPLLTLATPGNQLLQFCVFSRVLTPAMVQALWRPSSESAAFSLVAPGHKLAFPLHEQAVERFFRCRGAGFTPVARLHVRVEDDGLDVDTEVLNGVRLQPQDSPVDVYAVPTPAERAVLPRRRLNSYISEQDMLNVFAHVKAANKLDYLVAVGRELLAQAELASADATWVAAADLLPVAEDGRGAEGNVLVHYADRPDHYGLASVEFVREHWQAVRRWRRLDA